MTRLGRERILIGPYQNNGPVKTADLDMGDCPSNAALSALDVCDTSANVTLVSDNARTLAVQCGAPTRVRLDLLDDFPGAIRRQPLIGNVGGDPAYNGVAYTGGRATHPAASESVLADVVSPEHAGRVVCRVHACSWFNPSAVASPAPGTYGNMGISALRGPDSGTGLRRCPESSGRRRAAGRVSGEAFNVTNSLRLGSPVTSSLSGGQFGRITSSNGGPRIMQFALKYIF